jgi:hypothetical protein
MSSGRSAAAEVGIWAVFVSIVAGAGVLARYNLRLGRGDRRGAGRLAILVVCLSILSGMRVPASSDSADRSEDLAGSRSRELRVDSVRNPEGARHSAGSSFSCWRPLS